MASPPAVIAVSSVQACPQAHDFPMHVVGKTSSFFFFSFFFFIFCFFFLSGRGSACCWLAKIGVVWVKDYRVVQSGGVEHCCIIRFHYYWQAGAP